MLDTGLQTYNNMTGRSQEFETGKSGSGQVATSLNNDSKRQNSLVPGKFTPNSVLQQYMPSPNAMSSSDSARLLPNGKMLPTIVGSSKNTYDKLYPRLGMNLNL